MTVSSVTDRPPRSADWFADPLAGTGFDGVRPTTELTLALPAGSRARTAGVDLTDALRIRSALDHFGSRLVGRLCGPGERAVLLRYDEQVLGWGVALAFGLKEAVIKAARGFAPGGRFTDIDTSALLLHALRSPCDVTGTVNLTGATGTTLDGLTVHGGARRITDSLLVCWVVGVDGPRRTTAAPQQPPTHRSARLVEVPR